MYEIRKHKSEIREYYINKRRNIDEGEKAERDAKVSANFIASATFRFCDVLLLYMPKADEIDITPIALAALEAGKRVAFPCCNPDDRSMIFRYVSSLDELTESVLGISEPSPDCEAFDKTSCENANVVVVVPGIVYDKKGFRIGYGGGYYDRYLSSFAGTKVGVAYTDFIANAVPHGRFDLAVDVLMTERGIYAKK